MKKSASFKRTGRGRGRGRGRGIVKGRGRGTGKGRGRGKKKEIIAVSIVSVAEIHNTTTIGAAALTHATLKAHHTRCIKQNKITCTCIVRSQWRLGWHSRQKRPIEWRSRQPHPIQPTIALIRRTHANVSHMQCPCCSYTTTPRFMHPHPMSKMICTRSHPSSSLLIKVSTTLTLVSSHSYHDDMYTTTPKSVPPHQC